MAVDAELIPLWLNWKDRVVVVVGLGEVGQRRAITFQRGGAIIVGVDPLPLGRGHDWGELIRNGLELRSEPYDVTLFEELAQCHMRPDLVLACSTIEVNRIVTRDARERGHWVASATGSEASAPHESPSAHMGAVANGEFVRIAINSGNVAPAISVSLRDKIAETWLAAADRLAREAAYWRPLILRESIPPEERKILLASLGEPQWLSLEAAEPGAAIAEIRRTMRLRLQTNPHEESPDKER